MALCLNNNNCHTTKRKRPCACGSSDSRHRTKSWSNALTASRFLRPSRTAPLTHARQTSWQNHPGHHGIPGDEEADACAKQAAVITDGTPRPASFTAASALIRQTLTDPPPRHEEQTRSTPTRCHGRPTVGLPPRGATPSSSLAYEPVTPPPQGIHQSARHDSRPQMP